MSDRVLGAPAPAPVAGVVASPGARAPLAAPQYRGALIGFGGVARDSHVPGAASSPALRERLAIVVAVDPAPDAASATDIPVIAHRDGLGNFGAIDFVDVCTPTALHVSTTLWALEQGFHVLCEKPVAATRADAAAISAAARRKKRVVLPCHQHRFNPAWQQMHRWLRDGAIGTWHLAELSVYRPAADAGRDRTGRPWRTGSDDGAIGGGILLDHGTHLLYSLFDAAGTMPQAVRAYTGRLRHHAYAVEDTAHLLLEFPDRLATISLTWAAPHRENRVRFIGTEGLIDWQGGVLRLERAAKAPEVLDFSAQLDKRSYAGWFGRLFEQFVGALDDGAAPDALAEIERVARVLEAAQAAAASGARTQII